MNKIQKDSIVEKTSNINISQKEMDNMRIILNVEKKTNTIPKGYYNIDQITKTLKICRNTFMRRLSNINKNNVSIIENYEKTKDGRANHTVKYYKFKR